MLKTKRAFTLVELVIVLVILAILVGVALPTFMGVRAKAYRAEALGIMNEIKALAWCYRLQYGNDTASGWYPSETDGLSVFQKLGYSSSNIPQTANWNFTPQFRGNGIWYTYPPQLFDCTGDCLPNGCCFVIQASPRDGSSAKNAGAKNVTLVMNHTGYTAIVYQN